jgi:hypothetical protein
MYYIPIPSIFLLISKKDPVPKQNETLHMSFTYILESTILITQEIQAYQKVTKNTFKIVNQNRIPELSRE